MTRRMRPVNRIRRRCGTVVAPIGRAIAWPEGRVVHVPAAAADDRTRVRVTSPIWYSPARSDRGRSTTASRGSPRMSCGPTAGSWSRPPLTACTLHGAQEAARLLSGQPHGGGRRARWCSLRRQHSGEKRGRRPQVLRGRPRRHAGQDPGEGDHLPRGRRPVRGLRDRGRGQGRPHAGHVQRRRRHRGGRRASSARGASRSRRTTCPASRPSTGSPTSGRRGSPGSATRTGTSSRSTMRGCFRPPPRSRAPSAPRAGNGGLAEPPEPFD